jgi:hypothetical protein
VRLATAIHRAARHLNVVVKKPLNLTDSEWKQLVTEFEPFRRRMAELRANKSAIIREKSQQLAAEGLVQTARSATKKVDEDQVRAAFERVPLGSYVVKQYRQDANTGNSVVHVVPVAPDQVPDAAAFALQLEEVESDWFMSAQRILGNRVSAR